MKKYFIDIGSSTIKVYSFHNKELVLLEEKSIYMKNGFSNEKGISQENKKELLDYFNLLKEKYNFNINNTNIYATGIFRKMHSEIKAEFIKNFKSKINLNFSIISHDEENKYLELAMKHNYNNKKVLIINMGGKTTELVTFSSGEVIDRRNIEIGVAELMNKFSQANDKYSSVPIEEVVEYTNTQITEEFDTDYDCAIFTGGELRFEQLTGYNLVKNTLFDDNIHKYMISYQDFVKGNQKIFFELSIQELYNLMPQNPKWMDGARVGAVLSQAIFEKCGITIIIPSDLNLINGVVKNI